MAIWLSSLAKAWRGSLRTQVSMNFSHGSCVLFLAECWWQAWLQYVVPLAVLLLHAFVRCLVSLQNGSCETAACLSVVHGMFTDLSCDTAAHRAVQMRALATCSARIYWNSQAV